MNFNLLDSFLNRGILILNPSLKVKYWNNWLENKTGISAEKIIGKQLQDFFQLKPNGRKTIDRCFQYGQPQILSYVFHEYFIPIKVNHPNQMFMYQSAQITPMITNNEVESVMVVIDNVSESVLYERELKRSNTELKAKNQQLAASEQQLSAFNQQLRASEEELRVANDELITANAKLEELYEKLKKSEVRLSDAQHIAHIGNWELALLSGEVFLSNEMFQLIGLPNNDDAKNVASHKKYYTPESWELFTKTIEEARKYGKTYQLEMELSDRKNPCRFVIARVEPIFDSEQNIVALKGTLQDITEQKKRETEIKNQRDFIQMLLDNSPIGVATNDMDTQKVTYINDKFAEIYGWSKEEFPYTFDFFEKVFPDVDYRAKIQEKIVADISSGDPKRMQWEDLVITTQSGEKRVVVAVNIPLPEQNTMISTVQDITQRKKDEKEIIKAKEKAEESDKLKSAFLANMSHEIRTPMNGILGFSNLLNDVHYTEEKRKEFTNIIQQNGNNLLRLIDDIIDISKLDSEQLKLSLADCDIIQLLEQIHKTFQQILISKDLTSLSLQLELPENAKKLIINTDPDRLSQVINNLLTNAIKFSDVGIITLKFEIAGGKLRFSVADNGMGIPSEKQKTIFERFSQVNYNITNNKGGAGLGLAISKGIVDAFGGEIGVESELGKGSTFIVEIPYKPVEFITAREENIKTESKNLSNKTILIVDDDPTIRIYFKEVLKQLKVKVIEAENGKIAFKCYTDNPDIDLVLMDLKMPEMNGFDSLQAIKNINVYAKVIAQTAYAFYSEKEKCLEAGFIDYIVKPIKKEELFRKIQLWL